MSGSGFLDRVGLDAEARLRARSFGHALYGWRHDQRIQNARIAAAHLRVGPQFYADAEDGRMDPLDVAPSTALTLMQRTGLSAEALGFATPQTTDPAGAESASEPLPAGPSAPALAPAARMEGAPALSPPSSAGAPVSYGRNGSTVQAWYQVPGSVGFQIDWNGSPKTVVLLSIDQGEELSAALAQACRAGRRANARADMEGK